MILFELLTFVIAPMRFRVLPLIEQDFGRLGKVGAAFSDAHEVEEWGSEGLLSGVLGGAEVGGAELPP